MKMATIGVYLDHTTMERTQRYHTNVFQAYIEEMLAYAGIGFKRLDHIDQLPSSGCDIVIAAITGSPEVENDLWEYAAAGGGVISYGGLPYLATRLGCQQKPEIQVGYAALSSLEGAENRMLRWFHGRPWSEPDHADGYTASGHLYANRPDGERHGPVMQTFQVGSGWIARWAVNVPTVIVRLQQGEFAVTADGIPAKDGTGNVDDGILKADDQCQLDWELDRAYTESGMPYFPHPYADYWREAVIAHVLSVAAEQGLAVPFIDYWPEGIEQVAMISHDSDFNEDAAGECTLEVLAECDVRSTWCIIEPGYSPQLYPRIQQAGHELALHFNALHFEQGVWSQGEFNRQLAELKSTAGLEQIVSNKNHYTRFENWGELFRWCEEAGVQSDQTRGPSKKGNVGFPFGTCHPYFPIAWADESNRLYNVLEIGFLTQDINHPSLSDTSVMLPFLKKVKRVRGVAHFLFHQKHIYEQPEVRKALRMVVEEAKRQGFVFWTGRQINEWVRSKRKLSITGMKPDGSVLLEGKEEPVTVWRPLLHGETAAGAEVAERYGMTCIRTNVSYA